MKMDAPVKSDQCERKVETANRFYERIPDLVRELAASCARDDCFDHIAPEPHPSRESIVGIIRRARHILFPGYFSQDRVDPVNLEYYLGQETTALFESLAAETILAVRHDCLRYDQPCTHCIERGHEAAFDFIRDLPGLRVILATDVRAAYEGDPASQGYDEIIFGYPGLFAVTVHRMAHKLYELEVPILPRMMAEYAHGQTGIDIHPGAEIGESFFIDHGTGVVIGETTRIGKRVRLYQGVTLGALSLPRDAGDRLRRQRRHPTIEDEVIIYSGATILGKDAVIGARSVIGGNVWITGPVPPDTKVLLKTPELVYTGNSTGKPESEISAGREK